MGILVALLLVGCSAGGASKSSGPLNNAAASQLSGYNAFVSHETTVGAQIGTITGDINSALQASNTALASTYVMQLSTVTSNELAWLVSSPGGSCYLDLWTTWQTAIQQLNSGSTVLEPWLVEYPNGNPNAETSGELQLDQGNLGILNVSSMVFSSSPPCTGASAPAQSSSAAST